MERHDLLVLIVAVFSVFLLSMVGSLVAINKLSQGAFGLTTGRVAEGTGNVTIAIFGTISITTDDDDLIEFPGCKAGGLIESYLPQGGADGLCPGFLPDEILVRNDGTTPANISVQFSAWGEAHNGSFLDAADNSSWVAYKARNQSSDKTNFTGGCLQGLQSSLANVTGGGSFPVCGWLDDDILANSLSFDLALFVPATTAKGSSQLMIQFIATNPS